MSAGRQEAFEIFQRDYEHNDAIIDTKHSLKQRYVDAKTLGQEVNESRHKISMLVQFLFRIHLKPNPE